MRGRQHRGEGDLGQMDVGREEAQTRSRTGQARRRAAGPPVAQLPPAPARPRRLGLPSTWGMGVTTTCSMCRIFFSLRRLHWGHNVCYRKLAEFAPPPPAHRPRRRPCPSVPAPRPRSANVGPTLTHGGAFWGTRLFGFPLGGWWRIFGVGGMEGIDCLWGWGVGCGWPGVGGVHSCSP